MAQKYSKGPKKGTAAANKKQDNAHLCELFNTCEWDCLNKSGFLRVIHYKPKDNVFQHLSVKEQVFNESKNRWEEANRFRIGYITQHLTSVDIEEIVRVGCVIVDFFASFN